MPRYTVCDPATQNQSLESILFIYTSSKIQINKLSIDVWFVRIGQYLANYLKIWNLREQKKKNIEKLPFKVVQMKFLAMHIANKKFG